MTNFTNSKQFKLKTKKKKNKASYLCRYGNQAVSYSNSFKVITLQKKQGSKGIQTFVSNSNCEKSSRMFNCS